MAEITYWDLKRGKLLNKGDSLVIYGINYQVAGSNWFLNNPGGGNSAVFSLFGMTDTEKVSWAKEYAKRGVLYSGAFPEFSNQQDFIDFVIAIYEKPLLKEGDTIIVKSRSGCDDDYPYSYVDSMLEWARKRVTITKVLMGDEFMIAKKRRYNGDIHYYHIEDDHGHWNWHSSMFDLSTITVDKTSKAMHDDKSYVTIDEVKTKEEVSTKGITLNKPKKHFKTTIVL